jgi:hypothetical protein
MDRGLIAEVEFRVKKQKYCHPYARARSVERKVTRARSHSSEKSLERERRVPVGQEIEPGFDAQNPTINTDHKVP